MHRVDSLDVAMAEHAVFVGTRARHAGFAIKCLRGPVTKRKYKMLK